MSGTKNIEVGKRVIQIEAQAVAAISDRINEQFENAVNAVLNCKGRLIVLGVGKIWINLAKNCINNGINGNPRAFCSSWGCFSR